MKFWISTIFLILHYSLFSQEIRVIDLQSNMPIENVFIFNVNESASITTNKNGYFSLDVFHSGDTITFRHPSYFSQNITFSQLSEMPNVKLIENIIHIDEIVVSANKWEQSIGEIPNTISIISKKSIEFDNPQTSADLLDNSGRVFVQKSQLGGGSPMLRGFAANSVLIMIDGVRLNNAIFRSGNLQNILSISPSIIQGSEVIFGPGSVQYGSDALGGVMDFHTISPDFSQMRQTATNFFTRYSTANNERTASVNFSLTNKKVTWFSSLSVNLFDNLKSGSKRDSRFPDFGKRNFYVERENGLDIMRNNLNPNIQVGSGFNTYNTHHKLKFKLGDKSSLTLATYLSSSSNIPRYDRLNSVRNNLARYSEWYYGPQFWMRNNITYESNAKTKLTDELKLIISNQQFEESRHTRNFNSLLKTSRTEKVNLSSFNLEVNKSLSEKYMLFYGLEFAFNNINSSAIETNIESLISIPTSTRYPKKSTYLTSSAYTSLQAKISSKSVINLGIRYNKINSNASLDNFDAMNFGFRSIDINTEAMNGSFGYTIKPVQNLKLGIIGSSGFRAPNIDDAAKIFDSEPGNVIVPNPNLSPELVYSIDFNFAWNYKSLLKVESGVFYTLVDNLMVRSDYEFNGQDSILYDNVLSKVQTIKNAASGDIYGFYGILKVQPHKNYSIHGTINISDGNDSDGFPIRHTTPTFGKINVNQQLGRISNSISAIYNGARKFQDLPPSEQAKTDLYTSHGSLGWITFNYKMSYNVSEKITFYMGVDNIFDIHYRPYSSGISAPGRNLYLSLKINF